MRVGQAAQRPAPADPVIDMGAVRVALAIGEGVVLAVVRDPRDHRPLDRGGAERREHEAQRARGLEGAVCEEAVEADRDAEPREDIHDREHDHVRAVQQAVPQLPADEAERGNRRERDERGDDAIARLVRGQLDVVGSGRAGQRQLGGGRVDFVHPADIHVWIGGKQGFGHRRLLGKVSVRPPACRAGSCHFRPARDRRSGARMATCRTRRAVTCRDTSGGEW